MRNGPKRWEVTRMVFSNRAYRVHVPPEQLRLLEIQYLEFVRTGRTREEIETMLGQITDCPVERLQALRMTLGTGLYLGARTGRGGRLIDWTVQRGVPIVERLTDLGATWLAKVQEERENQDAEPA
jgi:hypothetical protein